VSFTITCTTCRSRLRVQNESAVGQIVACPKCRSMVMIELPDDHVASSPPARESSGEIQSRPSQEDRAGASAGGAPSSLLEGDVEQFLASAASSPGGDLSEKETVDEPLQAGKLPATAMRDRVTQDDSATGGSARPGSDPQIGPRKKVASHPDRGRQVTAQRPEVASSVDMDGGEEGESSSTEKPRDWLSEESRQLRRWGMIGGAGVALSIVVIVLIGLAISRRAGEATFAQQTSSSRPDAEQRGSDPDALVANAEEERSPDSGLEVARGEGEADRESPADIAEETRRANGAGDAAIDAAVDASINDDNAARTDGEAGNVDFRRDVENRAAGDESSPLPFEPAEMDIFEPFGPEDEGPRDAASDSSPPSSSRAEGGAADGAGSRAALPEPPGRRTFRLPPGLRDAEDLLLDRPSDPTLFLVDSTFDLIPVPGMPHDLGAAMPKPAPRQVNVTAQMNVQIPEVRFNEIPLRELVRFVSEFSTVPITLDADALERLGVAPDAPVTLQAEDLELGKIFQMALEPLQLEHRTVDSQLLVTEKDRDRLEERTYNVRDLIGDDPGGASALRSTVTGLIYPKTWEGVGGSGTLSLSDGQMTIINTPEVQFHVEIFCDHLRIARGLRPQGELPPNRANLDLRIAAALPKLEQTYQADFPVPAKLSAILDQIGQDVGMHFLVDWIALKGAGWNPDALARLELQEEPLSTVLQELLGPMQLSFRVIDARTLQVTTESAVAETLELGFFPLEDLRGDDAGQKVLEAVRAAIADVPKLERAGGGMRYDSPSQTLAVSAPQHQLAAVARQLEQLRLQIQ
jgi:hypothetical protein